MLTVQRFRYWLCFIGRRYYGTVRIGPRLAWRLARAWSNVVLILESDEAHDALKFIRSAQALPVNAQKRPIDILDAHQRPATGQNQ